MHTTLSAENAEISWLIPFVAYTPENYTVVYGRDPGLLNYSSDLVVGSDDITRANQMFSVTLNGLLANTTYYYQVTARNSIGTNSSNVEEITIPPPG